MNPSFFRIPGCPIALNRPRSVFRNGSVSVYDNQKNLKIEVIKSLKSQMLSAPFSNALNVSLQFMLEPANTHRDKNLKLWNIDTNSCKDIDNLVKFYLDCGNDLLWKDDRQICVLNAKKMFSENPCTIIKIEALNIFSDEKFMDVFKVFSPQEIESLVSDAHSLPAFNLEAFEKMPEVDRHRAMAQIATRLMSFSSIWSNKIKKLNSTKVIRY